MTCTEEAGASLRKREMGWWLADWGGSDAVLTGEIRWHKRINLSLIFISFWQKNHNIIRLSIPKSYQNFYCQNILKVSNLNLSWWQVTPLYCKLCWNELLILHCAMKHSPPPSCPCPWRNARRGRRCWRYDPLTFSDAWFKLTFFVYGKWLL